MSVEKIISPLIQEQFPEFYRVEGENFIAFVKAYYEWLEQANNTLFHSRSLPDYRDVDTTPEDFIIHFKEKYLRNIEFETTTNKRLLLKHSLDIYRSKGTDRAIDLLFKLVYGTGAEVRRPADDIFKASDGIWVRPKYIEVSFSKRTVDLVGKQITGVSSGSSAFVEKYVKRRVQGSYVYILYVSNIVGGFKLGELLRADQTFPDLPTVQGSLSDIQITSPGSTFSIGDIVEIKSSSGDHGFARVANTASRAGVVDFLFVDGGWGYTTNAVINISNTVLGLANVQANTADVFAQFESVVEPITDITYTSLNGTFASGQTVFSSVGSGVGRIITLDNTAASIKISRESGDFTVAGKVFVAGNTVNATIATSVNNDITGLVTKLPTEVGLVMTSNVGFEEQQVVFQTSGGNETANGTIKKITSTVLDVTNVIGSFVPSLPLQVKGSGVTGTVLDTTMQLALHNISGTFTATNSPIVYGTVSGPTARITSIAGGSGASFSIAGIDDTETIQLNTDYLNGNNSSNVSYLTLRLNANTYGFPDNPSANISGNLWDAFHFQDFTIGEITGITGINPGSGYASSPSVTINEPYVSCFQRKDYKFVLSNTTLNFVVGESVTQDNLIPGYDLVVASNTGWVNGEFVFTTTGNGNIISIFGSTVRVSNIQGSFANAQVLHSIISSTNSTITTAFSNAQLVRAHGTVEIGGAAVLRVKREQFDNHWIENGNNIIGQTTGASAKISHLSEWTNATPIGLNAVVTANVVTANGTVTFLSVTDSGYGYEKGQQVSFIGPSDAGLGNVVTSAIGTGGGFFKSTKGFLSADKYLFDGDFYQEYSYEVLSRLPFDRYSEVLKKVLHIAGTKPFGSVILESEVQMPETTASTSVVQT